MDEENEKNDIQVQNGNYITGIIGAIIGGAIATIPWIFVYVKFNYILSLLAMVIAFGSLKGYEIFKGKMDKKIKIIITIISLLLVIITTLIFIPSIYSFKFNITLKTLYSNTEFMNALYRDLAVSLVFAVLGITSAYPYINRKLLDNGIQVIDPEIVKKQDEIREIELNNKLNDTIKEELKIVKTAFEELNALTPENAILENEAISKMNHPNAEKIFKKFKNKKIIIKYRNKYYYNKNNTIYLANSNSKNIIIGILIVVVLIAMCGLITNFTSPTNNKSISNIVFNEKTFTIQDIKFSTEVPNSWEQKENEFVNVLFLLDSASTGNINIIPTKKSELQNYSLETYANTLLKEYMYDEYAEYNPEQNSEVEKTKIGDYDVYTIKLYSPSENIYMIGYWIETENHFVEIYGISLKDSIETNQKIFEKAVSSYKEVN